MNDAKEMAKTFAKGVDYNLLQKAMKVQGFGWISPKGKGKYLPSEKELYKFIKQMVKLLLDNDELNCIDNGNMVFMKVFKQDTVEVSIAFPIMFKLEFEISYEDFEQDEDNFEGCDCEDGGCGCDCSGEGCDFESSIPEEETKEQDLIKNMSETIGDLQAQIAYFEDRFSELVKRYSKAHDAEGNEIEPSEIQKEMITNIKFILDDTKEEE